MRERFFFFSVVLLIYLLGPAAIAVAKYCEFGGDAYDRGKYKNLTTDCYNNKECIVRAPENFFARTKGKTKGLPKKPCEIHGGDEDGEPLVLDMTQVENWRREEADRQGLMIGRVKAIEQCGNPLPTDSELLPGEKHHYVTIPKPGMARSGRRPFTTYADRDAQRRETTQSQMIVQQAEPPKQVVIEQKLPEKVKDAELKCVTPESVYAGGVGFLSAFSGYGVDKAVMTAGPYGFLAAMGVAVVGYLFAEPAIKFIANLIGWEGDTQAKGICNIIAGGVGGFAGYYTGKAVFIDKPPPRVIPQPSGTPPGQGPPPLPSPGPPPLPKP